MYLIDFFNKIKIINFWHITCSIDHNIYNIYRSKYILYVQVLSVVFELNNYLLAKFKNCSGPIVKVLLLNPPFFKNTVT